MVKIRGFMFWTPRVLAIIFILFLTLFSLDVFEGNYGFWGTLSALFIHNIPSIILLIVLIVSWNREIVGGVAFIFAGILYLMFILKRIIETGFEWHYLVWSVLISGVAFFIGVMFLAGSRKKAAEIRKRFCRRTQKRF